MKATAKRLMIIGYMSDVDDRNRMTISAKAHLLTLYYKKVAMHQMFTQINHNVTDYYKTVAKLRDKLLRDVKMMRNDWNSMQIIKECGYLTH